MTDIGTPERAPMEGLETYLVASGDIQTQYGPLRLAAAEHFGKNPEDITGEDAARYEQETQP